LGFEFWGLEFGVGGWVLVLSSPQSRRITEGYCFRGLGFEFWVLGFGFWVLGFGFWVLGFGFWVLGFGFWVLSFAGGGLG
jgi:hypothetical protein